MLTRLAIHDFAIIDNLELEWGPELVILTGETGAGKSILLDAIQALTGGGVDASMVRAGASKARLEAAFDYRSDQFELVEVLEREDLMEEPGQITLEREIRLEGRSGARVNGHSVSQTVLREIGGLLIDIHGQSEHLSLLNTHAHLGLLDRFADDGALLTEYQTRYRKLTGIRRELEELVRLEKEDQSRLELLQFQLDEITAARLQEGEEEELEKERTRLANAENLAGLAQECLALLDEASPEVPSVVDLLAQLAHQVNSLVRVDASQTELSDQAASLLENVQDLAASIRGYAEEIEFNPRRLEEVEERLELIHRLTRKYGGSVASAQTFAEKNQAALERISHAGDRIEELGRQEESLLGELSALAVDLSARRKSAAGKLSKAVEGELDQLRMQGARFTVEQKNDFLSTGLTNSEGERVRFDLNGFDQVEFLIAPNPGEGFKPLVKIASGGETSRLMLALKNVLAREDRIPTLIFDEIDQGIGGRVGMVVGRKLWELARFHQVLCVTHLPQLAAYGGEHYRVSKQVQGNRTSTHVEKLDEEQRVMELAQMLGTDTESNRRAARELLHSVQTECSNPK
jgi:DNA repair protein RecN (Recombination protein N)